MKYKFILWLAKRKEQHLLKVQRKYDKWLKEVYLPTLDEEISINRAKQEMASKQYNQYDAYLK